MLTIGRVIVISYFVMFMASTGLGRLVTGPAQGLVLVAPAVFVALVIMQQVLRCLRRGRIPRTLADPVVWLMLAYATTYSVLYFPRAFSGIEALGGAGSLAVHALFFLLVVRVYYVPAGLVDEFWSDLWWSIIAGMLFGFVTSMAHVGWTAEPGALHNLSDVAPFVRSDLDVPFLAVVVALLGWQMAARRMNRPGLRLLGRRLSGPLVGPVLLAGALLVLVMYSRRAAILGLAALLVYQKLPRLGRRMALGGLLLAPLVPLFWDAASRILLILTQNRVAEALIARNDAEAILTASNRVTTWLLTIDFLSDWNPQHLVGYGGAPEWVLPEGLSWLHTHNGALQVILDAGLVTFTMALSLVILAFRRYLRASTSGTEAGNPSVALGVLIFWVLLSGIEPTLRNYTIVHFTFLTLCAGTLTLPPVASPAVDSRRAPSRLMEGRAAVGHT